MHAQDTTGDADAGRALQALMDALYVAPIDLARELGVAPTTIARWTSGELRPRSEDLAAIERIFGRHGWPAVDELVALPSWRPGAQGHELRGGTENVVDIAPALATHLRLTIHPDGGVARLRVVGRPDRGVLEAAFRRSSAS